MASVKMVLQNTIYAGILGYSEILALMQRSSFFFGGPPFPRIIEWLVKVNVIPLTLSLRLSFHIYKIGVKKPIFNAVRMKCNTHKYL
jgi:hypothetical protein